MSGQRKPGDGALRALGLALSAVAGCLLAVHFIAMVFGAAL